MKTYAIYRFDPKGKQWHEVTKEVYHYYPSGRRLTLYLADGQIVKADYCTIIQVFDK